MAGGWPGLRGGPGPAQTHRRIGRNAIRARGIEAGQSQRGIEIATPCCGGKKRHGGARIGNAERGVGAARHALAGQVGLGEIDLGEVIALIGGGTEQADHLARITRHATPEAVHEGQRGRTRGVTKVGRGAIGGDGAVDVGADRADGEIVVISQPRMGRADARLSGAVIKGHRLAVFATRLRHGGEVEQRATGLWGERHGLLTQRKRVAQAGKDGTLGGFAHRNLGRGRACGIHAGGNRDLGAAASLAFLGQTGNFSRDDGAAGFGLGLGLRDGSGLGGGGGLGSCAGLGGQAFGLGSGGLLLGAPLGLCALRPDGRSRRRRWRGAPVARPQPVRWRRPGLQRRPRRRRGPRRPDARPARSRLRLPGFPR